MFKTETDVINWIYSFTNTSSHRSLDHLHDILENLANPHKALKTIHVAGTNGKGSTVSFMREGLRQANYNVATFTSPYITCFGERMSINNEPISEEKLIQYASALKKALPVSTVKYTSFDIITLISFLYFKDACVDIAIYETGIGGRLDSTNVIVPLATAITNVGHDHAEILGKSQSERATEKLGIVKDGIPLFTTEEDPCLLAVFEVASQEKNAPFYQPLEDALMISQNSDGVVFNCCQYERVKIGMHGVHQFKNASLAVTILEYLRTQAGFDRLNPTAISNARWQGRFEYIQKEPPIILDGAHNIEGIEALVDTLKKVHPDEKIKIVFSALTTKDVTKMVKKLEEISPKIEFTESSHPSTNSAQKLADQFDKTYVSCYKVMVKNQVKHLKKNDVLVFCGSLYFIADVREFLLTMRRFSK